MGRRRETGLELGFGQRAEAGVSYDFVFRAGGGGVSNGVSYTFASFTAAHAGTPVMDVLLRTTDPLFAASVSIVWDNSDGLRTTSAQEWFGQGIVFNMMNVANSFAPLGGLACNANTCSSFDGVVIPPNGPPSLPPGTYNIGTIVWDTSGLTTARSAVMTQVLSGVDGTGAVVGGNKVDVTGSEVVEMGFINIVPEPTTAGLLGLGLASLVMAGRRRRA